MTDVYCSFIYTFRTQQRKMSSSEEVSVFSDQEVYTDEQKAVGIVYLDHDDDDVRVAREAESKCHISGFPTGRGTFSVKSVRREVSGVMARIRMAHFCPQRN